MTARRIWGVLCLAAALVVPGSGCLFRRTVAKSPYQTALEAYSKAGTVQELEAALPVLTAALDRDPSDVQARLLRAAMRLRIAREERLKADTWKSGGHAAFLADDLRRILGQLGNTPSGLGWIGARAYITAADLALIRAQTAIEAAEPSGNRAADLGDATAPAAHLQARALQQIARDFYAFAFQTADSLLKGSPGQMAPALAAQRDHALEGYVSSEAGIAQSDDRLDLAPAPLARLAAVREAALKGLLPPDAGAFGATVSLEARVHDRDWRILRALRPTTQTESLRLRELAFREQVAASFLEEPGRARHYTGDVLEDLITNLAAMRLRWTILAPAGSSQDELRIRVLRHSSYPQYAAPVLDFALYLGDRKVLEASALAHRPVAAGRRPGPVFVGESGSTLILHSGDAPEQPPSAPDEFHLYLSAGPRFDFLAQKGARLRLVDGFGNTTASLVVP